MFHGNKQMHQLPAPSSQMCLWGPLPARPAAGVPFQIHEFTHLPEGSTEVILKTHSPTRMKKTCAQSKPFWDLNLYSCIHVVTHVYSFNGQMRLHVSRYALTTSIRCPFKSCLGWRRFRPRLFTPAGGLFREA